MRRMVSSLCVAAGLLLTSGVEAQHEVIITQDGPRECQLTTLEAGGHGNQLLTIAGTVMDFDTNSGWLTITSGSFANNPSGTTVAFWATGTSGVVNFTEPVSSVTLFYSSFPDVRLEAFDVSGNLIAFDSGPSNLASSNPFFRNWDPLAVCAIGISSVRLTGDAEFTMIDDFKVCIGPPDSSPVAEAGPAQTVVASGGNPIQVTLDGSGSTGSGLTYTWFGPFSEGGGTVTGQNPTVTLPVGVHSISLVVEEDTGCSAGDQVAISVMPSSYEVIITQDGPRECQLLTFEGGGEGPVAPGSGGSVDGSVVNFTPGSGWQTSEELSNVANLPSGTTYLFMNGPQGVPAEVTFDEVVSSVSLRYTSFVGVSLRAYDGNGDLVGLDTGATNTNPSTPQFSNWDLLSICAPGIARVEVVGFPLSTIIDDFTVCIGPLPSAQPIANAGSSQTVEAVPGDPSTQVTLDGSGSSDPDGGSLTYMWSGPFPEGGGTITGVSPTVTLLLGTHTILLVVTDISGCSDVAEVEITVDGCLVVDFEDGIQGAQYYPGTTVPGTDIRFSSEWRTLTSGPFSNNPSGSVVAFFSGHDFGEVTFDNAVPTVSMSYASIPAVTLEAFDSGGNLVASASGPGNAILPPPPGGLPLQVWDPIGVDAGSPVIVRVRFSGISGQTLIDDFSTCPLPATNAPPVADAGEDQSVEWAGGPTSVTLDGSGSSDPDDDDLAFTWTGAFPEGGGSATGEGPTVTLPLGTHTITLTVDDGNGGTATDEVVVLVVQSATRYSLIATHSMHIKQKATVHSGDVGVVDFGDPPFQADGVELVVGQRVETAVNVRVNGPRVRVKQRADILGTLVYSELVHVGQNATIANEEQVAAANWSLFSDGQGLPAFVSRTPGVVDVEVKKNESATLSPTDGPFNEIRVRQKGTLTFAGGEYHIANLDIGQNATIEFSAATTLLIADKLAIDQKTTFGPLPGSGIDASDILVYVEGVNGKAGGSGDDDGDDDDGDDDDGDDDDGDDGGGSPGSLKASPKAVKVGQKAVCDANIYAPNGTIHLRQKSTNTGAFIGKDIVVGKKTKVHHLSGFGASDESGGSGGTGGGVLKPTLAYFGLEAEPEISTVSLSNHPNPFNPVTTINYSLPDESHVRLVIYSALGQEVRRLVDEVKSVGRYSVRWDGRDALGRPVSSGVYLYRLVAGREQLVGKMVLAK